MIAGRSSVNIVAAPIRPSAYQGIADLRSGSCKREGDPAPGVRNLCLSTGKPMMNDVNNPNAKFYIPGRSCRRQVEGGTPTNFLNARLKEASDS